MDLKELKERFDVCSYLSDLGVAWSGLGDNVGEGWVGIKCIYCMDKMNHLGINLKGKYFKCWKCSASGDIVKLIRDLEDVEFFRAVERLKQYASELYVSPKQEKILYTGNNNKEVRLPPFAERIKSGLEPKIVRVYFRRRNFSLDLCRRYRLYYCARGNWKFRLIVPIYYRGRMVSFQGVDVTGKAGVRYKNCPKEWAIIQNRHLVYGIDSVKNQCILVEGVTDKWRIGDGACALFGKNVTKEQLSFLSSNLDRGVKIKTLFDADAYRKTRALGHGGLNYYFLKVISISLEKGDPADLTADEVEKIRVL